MMEKKKTRKEEEGEGTEDVNEKQEVEGMKTRKGKERWEGRDGKREM